MALLERFELVCDGCGAAGEQVRTHGGVVDKKSGKVEACDTCWDTASAAFLELLAKGRSSGEPKVVEVTRSAGATTIAPTRPASRPRRGSRTHART